MMFNLSTLRRKRFHNEFWNLKYLKKICLKKKNLTDFFHPEIHKFLIFLLKILPEYSQDIALKNKIDL